MSVSPPVAARPVLAADLSLSLSGAIPEVDHAAQFDDGARFVRSHQPALTPVREEPANAFGEDDNKPREQSGEEIGQCATDPHGHPPTGCTDVQAQNGDHAIVGRIVDRRESGDPCSLPVGERTFDERLAGGE